MKDSKQNIFIGIGIIGVLILFGIVSIFINSNNSEDISTAEDDTVAIQANQADRDDQLQGGRPPQVNEAEKEAIDNKDFDAWLNAIDEANPLAEVITSEELFFKYIEMQEAIQNNDEELAEELRIELGLPEMTEDNRPEGGPEGRPEGGPEGEANPPM